MDKDTLLFLLKGGHIDMPTRISKKIWPHSPITLSKCINLILDFLKLNKYFPTPWVDKKDGELIGDLMIIEKVNENKFICKYRYSDPVNLLKISEAGEKVFKFGYEAVKYYLQHELHLPGDLDGWRVIDDNLTSGNVKKSKKLKRLEEGDIIAFWEWSQGSWNEIAGFYAVNSDFPLEVFFSKGFFSVITIAIASSLSFVFIQKAKKPFPQATGGLTFIDKLAMFGIIALLILIVIWLLRWLHDYFYLRPKKGEEPNIIIGKRGIKLGNRFFFFESPMVLSKIELLELKSDKHPYSVNMDISCGSMTGKIAIPVPQGKIAEAQKIITELSVVDS